MAEVHGNRTHLGGYQPPTLDLKSRRPTSDLRTSSRGKISKGLMNVKIISQIVSVSLSSKCLKLCPSRAHLIKHRGQTVFPEMLRLAIRIKVEDCNRQSSTWISAPAPFCYKAAFLSCFRIISQTRSCNRGLRLSVFLPCSPPPNSWKECISG